MDPKEIENLDSEIEEVQGIADDETDIEAIKEKAQKAIELAKKAAGGVKKLNDDNKQLFARTKKAEGFELKDGKWVKATKEADPEPKNPPAPVAKDGDLPQKDLIALIKNDVHDDDVEEVVTFAKVRGISVSEALKSDVIKVLLDQKKQYRETQEAANTKTTKTVKKVDEDKVLEDVAAGKIPAKGSKEAELLYQARIKQRRGGN